MSQITVVTERASFVETAASAPPEVRILIEVRVSVSDLFEAYRRPEIPTPTDSTSKQPAASPAGGTSELRRSSVCR